MSGSYPHEGSSRPPLIAPADTTGVPPDAIGNGAPGPVVRSPSDWFDEGDRCTTGPDDADRHHATGILEQVVHELAVGS